MLSTNMKLILVSTLSYAAAWSPVDPPTMTCVVEPTLQLVAGESELTNMVLMPTMRRCEATLYFSDSSFLPYTVEFNATYCDGTQVNSFQVPKTVPDGFANIVWRCADMQPSCYQVEISSGTGDPDSPRYNHGRVGCLMETQQTLTTLLTITRTTGTVVTSVPTTLTSYYTLFMSTSTTVDPPTITGTTPTKINTGGTVPTSESSSSSDGRVTTTSVPDKGQPARPTTSTSTGEKSSTTPALDAATTKTASSLADEMTTSFRTISESTSDGPFINTTPRSVIPVVTMSIVSTITATVTAQCI